jgi:RNA polymerase sigma factor (sigma-70 family)
MRTNDGADGFDEVFRDLYPRARRVAMRILGSVPDAEDAASEGLARALVDWHRVAAMPHRDAWILRVTTNVAIDVARRRARSLPDPGEATRTDDETVLRLTLVAALAELPARQREAVVLRHLAGLPERDVAAALGVSTNTVKKHLQRGMARLRSSPSITEEVSLAFE